MDQVPGVIRKLFVSVRTKKSATWPRYRTESVFQIRLEVEIMPQYFSTEAQAFVNTVKKAG